MCYKNGFVCVEKAKAGGLKSAFVCPSIWTAAIELIDLILSNLAVLSS